NPALHGGQIEGNTDRLCADGLDAREHKALAGNDITCLAERARRDPILAGATMQPADLRGTAAGRAAPRSQHVIATDGWVGRPGVHAEGKDGAGHRGRGWDAEAAKANQALHDVAAG